MYLINYQIQIGGRKISLIACLWFLLAGLAVLAEILRGPESINNYFIYKGVFTHSLSFKNLYLNYPAEYLDSNHYGPLFSLLIAPFALLPNSLGCFLWCIANAWVLFYAIQQLPLTANQKNGILAISLIEMLTAIHNVQFNPMLTGWILLGYTLVKKEKDFWAALWIVAGILIKIYSVVGLVFFLFSKHKTRFVLGHLFWAILLFCLPMLISSPAFVWQSYFDWYQSLVEKNMDNLNIFHENKMQDISVQGLIQRIGKLSNFSTLWVVLPAAIGYLLPLLRWKQFLSKGFQMSYLSLALIGVVIFSSSAESPTYVIAMTGVGIWFLQPETPKNSINIFLLGLSILLTSLSATDLFPRWVRMEYIIPYSLKALPCLLIWIALLVDLLGKKYSHLSNSKNN